MAAAQHRDAEPEGVGDGYAEGGLTDRSPRREPAAEGSAYRSSTKTRNIVKPPVMYKRLVRVAAAAATAAIGFRCIRRDP